MANILKRPMFKIGGSADGVGITSGLARTGFNDPTVTDETIIEARDKVLNPEKPEYGWDELISDAYRTSKDAPTFKDWMFNAADLALERGDAEKERIKNKPAKDLEMLEAIRAQQIAKAQKDRELDIKATDPTIAARMDLMKSVMVTVDEWKKANPGLGIKDFLESGNVFEIDANMRNANPAWPGVTSILMDIEDRLDSLIAADAEDITKPKWTEEMKEDYRNRQIQNMIGSYLGFKGNAMGGKPIRRGYNMGMGPVMDQDVSMTENIMTPQGDMSMTENVDTAMMGQQAGMPSQTMAADDPYVLLRARLPEEITDEVVQLIAYNPDAFADFADIETQDDVIAFNRKWGVELVVNTDEMSGAIA